MTDSLHAHSLNTWNGTTSDEWNNTSNWNTGLISDSLADVHIPVVTTGTGDYPELTAAGECHNISIAAGASILGNSNLTVTGTATVETNISADRWHMVSPPVDGQKAGVFHLGGTPNVYLTDYDEATETYNYIQDLNADLNNMQGYMVWMNSARYLVEYSGNLNAGSFGSTSNLTRNSLGEHAGWNMVGNPYPSTIDWDAASGWTKTNLANSIYIINSTIDGTWASYVGGTGGIGTNGGASLIAPGQGFFVRVSSGNSGGLQMTDAVRVNNNTPFLKSRDVTDFAKLAVTGYNKTDETVVRFLDEASPSFDSQYDAYKRFATNESYPQVYTYADVDYSINSLPFSESIPMGFTCSVDGDYSISIVEMDGIGHLWVEDLKNGTFTDLLTENYTFSHQADDNPERFVLHYSPVSVNEAKPHDIHIFANQSWVNVRSNDYRDGNVVIYNLLGQVIANKALSDGYCKIPVEKQGYYLVKVLTEQTTVTQKVFVD